MNNFGMGLSHFGMGFAIATGGVGKIAALFTGGE
jgi:hypothetical protein